MKNIDEYKEDLCLVIKSWEGKESRDIGEAFIASALPSIETKSDLADKLNFLIKDLEAAHKDRHEKTFMGISITVSWTKSSGLAAKIRNEILALLEIDIITGPEKLSDEDCLFPNDFPLQAEPIQTASTLGRDVFSPDASHKTRSPLNKVTNSEQGSVHESDAEADFGLTHENLIDNPNSDGNKSECGSDALSFSTMTSLGLDAMTPESLYTHIQLKIKEFETILSELDTLFITKSEDLNCELSDLIQKYNINKDRILKISLTNTERPELNSIFVSQMNINSELKQIDSSLKILMSEPALNLVLTIYSQRKKLEENTKIISGLTDKAASMEESLKELKQIKIQNWQQTTFQGLSTLTWGFKPSLMGLKALVPKVESTESSSTPLSTSTEKLALT